MPKKKIDDIVIQIDGVTRIFPIGERGDGKLYVLRGISLIVNRGQVVAIVGASGAGKSTLLHIMGTLDRPTSGKVLYDGVDVFSLSDDALATSRIFSPAINAGMATFSSTVNSGRR